MKMLNPAHKTVVLMIMSFSAMSMVVLPTAAEVEREVIGPATIPDELPYKLISALLENIDSADMSMKILEQVRNTKPDYLLSALGLYLGKAQEGERPKTIHLLIAYTYYELFKWKYSLYPEKGLVPIDLSITTNAYRRCFDSEIDKAAEADPSCIAIYNVALEMARINHEDERAMWAVQKKLGLLPHDLGANLAMAKLCFGNMAIDPETARPEYVNKTIKYAKIVLAADPANSDALYYLAGAYKMGGHYELAKPLYRKCLELEKNPNSRRARQSRFWISKMEQDIKNKKCRPIVPFDE